jgi:hypothetical protein
VTEADTLPDLEGIEMPNLEAARVCAMRHAYSIMADDTSKGQLNLNYCIEIADGGGKVLDTVYFRDLVEIAGLQAR